MHTINIKCTLNEEGKLPELLHNFLRDIAYEITDVKDTISVIKGGVRDEYWRGRGLNCITMPQKNEEKKILIGNVIFCVESSKQLLDIIGESLDNIREKDGTIICFLFYS